MIPGMPSIHITTEQETDGRWIGAVESMPGVLAYSATREEAIAHTQALALRVLADRIDSGELAGSPLTLAFEAA